MIGGRFFPEERGRLEAEPSLELMPTPHATHAADQVRIIPTVLEHQTIIMQPVIAYKFQMRNFSHVTFHLFQSILSFHNALKLLSINYFWKSHDVGCKNRSVCIHCLTPAPFYFRRSISYISHIKIIRQELWNVMISWWLFIL